ncbi:methyl-accepting chemotaxis protein [Siculibacillus lacustris]|uniref:Methyl-accepting chemotaxis protein n=1 Tax=Siculibacillus lacustris TaxID=1549641 RepID=A0A4Q9VS03_9HYPH|nr:HAMP domain-containing methyl-accepting chemotaxis protein [Siculibacillus lacustris]TBW38237.1 methyl-accepting chemotaxis protein [Siculibacillus lacustris]
MAILRTLSIKWVLGLFLGAMGLVVFTYGGIDLKGSIKRQSAAEAILSSSRSSRILLSTLLTTRLERGALGSALSGEAAADGAQLAKIADYRKTIEGGYREVIAQIEAAALPGPLATLPRLRDAQAAMVRLQPEFDREARTPKASRNPQAQQTELATYQAFFDALTATTDAVDASAGNTDKTVDQYLAIKRAAWATRVQYGVTQGRAQFTVAAGRAWTPTEAAAAFEDRGRALGAWTVVKEAASADGVADVVRAAFRKADEGNFSGPAWADTVRLFEALATGQPAGIDIKDLQPRDTARAGLVVDLANVALDQMVLRAEQVVAEARGAFALSIAALAASLLLVAGGIVVVQRRISRPLQRMNETMRRLAEGDEAAIVPSLERGDEIGEMARAVQVFKESLARNKELEAATHDLQQQAEVRRRQTMLSLADDLERAVGAAVTTLSSSADEMQSTARAMSDSATATLAQSTSVAAAAEQASTNVAAVAGAAEELGTSVQEIGRQVEHSVGRARSAVEAARSAAEIIGELETAASRINAIVDLISDIAGQTNLLALNATIEAARAGEAGRGFAVVAAEVKELATQTSRATTEIGQQVAAIQATTDRAVTAIGGVATTVQEINASAEQIAATVDQQGQATNEIVTSVTQASVGADGVTSIIADVAQAAGRTGDGARRVLDVSGEVAGHAADLHTKVVGFLATIRAA